MLRKILFVAMLSFFNPSHAQEPQKFDVSNIYFHMGVVGAFAEMVYLDVKKIGLSEMFTAEEAEKWEPVIKQIADRNGVKYYREDSFLVTDLYPAMKTEGLSLYLLYKGDTLDQYLNLKEKQKTFIENDQYDAMARREIASQFGKLLSYPENIINELIDKNG